MSIAHGQRTGELFFLFVKVAPPPPPPPFTSASPLGHLYSEIQYVCVNKIIINVHFLKQGP